MLPAWSNCGSAHRCRCRPGQCWSVHWQSRGCAFTRHCTKLKVARMTQLVELLVRPDEEVICTIRIDSHKVQRNAVCLGGFQTNRRHRKGLSVRVRRCQVGNEHKERRIMHQDHCGIRHSDDIPSLVINVHIVPVRSLDHLEHASKPIGHDNVNVRCSPLSEARNRRKQHDARNWHDGQREYSRQSLTCSNGFLCE